jgi:hypothetical protein
MEPTPWTLQPRTATWEGILGQIRPRYAKHRKAVRLGETFLAKHTGRCRSCKQLWQPGDYISAQPGGGYGHAVCPNQDRPLYRVAPE